MKQKVLLLAASAVGACLCFGAGVVVTSYAVLAMELNDRLKYEAAYLKGFSKIQRAIKSKDYDKAERIGDVMIDAHAYTLQEFNYLASSLLFSDIDEVLCEVTALRREFPVRRVSNDELSQWYKEVDTYLEGQGREC